jgi:hypothetical protein
MSKRGFAPRWAITCPDRGLFETCGKFHPATPATENQPPAHGQYGKALNLFSHLSHLTA